MPANKNAETRYKILDRLLARRYGNYTTEDLRDLVNEELLDIYGKEKFKPVSIRTIQYDLRYLEGEPFMADIEHYSFETRTIRRMMQFAQTFPDIRIVTPKVVVLLQAKKTTHEILRGI